MLAESKNPYENALCVIFVKSAILFRGKLSAGAFVESKILKWMREGVTLEGDVFVPWSNISSVCPRNPLEVK